jgi:menaquinone-specific isochorismate synthase
MTALVAPRLAVASTPPRPVATPWDGAEPPPAPPRLVSLFAPASGLSAAAFVRAARGGERFYWAEPGDGLVLAGAGVAAQLMAAPVLPVDAAERRPAQRFDEIEDLARALFAGAQLQPATAVPPDAAALARPRLFGGFAFQDDFVPDNTWADFSPAEFVLPHYQLAQHDGAAYLTINALVGPEEDLGEALSGLAEALAARLAVTTEATPSPLGRPTLRYPMTRALWDEMIDRATATIAAGVLDKVVLARVCEVRSAATIDAAVPLAYLDAHYGDSYRFLFEPRPHHAFLGATPELLVGLSGCAVTTMALAGSAARGQTPDEDEALAAALLASAKDRHEHELVVAAVRAHLAEAADELTAPAAPVVLRLRNIQHLLTPIAGRLRPPGDGALQLVRRLHPTPAMGGVPPERALAFLRDAEPVPRGWYAAPIGWIDGALDGVFAVGIRSAITQHSRAWLYAGAGIVAGSSPEREWAETALKFRPMLGALGAAEGN